MHRAGASGDEPEFFRDCVQLAHCDDVEERRDIEGFHLKLSALQLVLF